MSLRRLEEIRRGFFGAERSAPLHFASHRGVLMANIRCRCGRRHANVADVRQCQLDPRLDASPHVIIEATSSGIPSLACPQCPNAEGALLPDGVHAICESCGTPWDTSQPAVHSGSDLVWTTTSSGAVYHSEKNCYWREAGQKQSERSGRERAQLVQKTRGRAQSENRAPCQACTPRSWMT